MTRDPVRPPPHLYLSAPRELVRSGGAAWAGALGTEARRRLEGRGGDGAGEGWGRLLSPRTLLVGGEAPEALGADLPGWVTELLGSEAVKGLREWSVEVDSPEVLDRCLDPWRRGGVHRVVLRGAAADPGWVARILRRDPGCRIAAEASTARAAWALLAAGSEAVAWVETDPFGGDTDLARVDRAAQGAADWLRWIRRALREGWIVSDLATAHRPGAAPGYRMALARRSPVFGLGPGAVSLQKGERRRNLSGWTPYLESLAAGGSGVDEVEVLLPREVRLERIWLALRRARGLRLPLALLQAPMVTRWRTRGWVRVEGRAGGPGSPGSIGAPAAGIPGTVPWGWLRPTPRGWLRADSLAVELLEMAEGQPTACGDGLQDPDGGRGFPRSAGSRKLEG